MRTQEGWFKSSHSGTNGNCVEVRMLPDGAVQVRDTKMRGRGPVLTFTAAEWIAFMAGARAGEFDCPAS